MLYQLIGPWALAIPVTLTVAWWWYWYPPKRLLAIDWKAVWNRLPKFLQLCLLLFIVPWLFAAIMGVLFVSLALLTWVLSGFSGSAVMTFINSF